MNKTFIIDKDMDGRKIEYILSGTLGFSANIIKILKQTEGVLLNGEPVHLNKKASLGDELAINMEEDENKNIVPENIPLDIIYEDEDILAVNKPRAMPTHPSRGHYTSTLANGVVFYLKNSAFRVITRLDKDTSGVVLIAKNKLAAHKLNKAMRQCEINKEYVALVNGVPEIAESVIKSPIAKGEGIKRIVSEKGKEAVTKYSVICAAGDFALVRLEPVTGRTHQLRVHMQHIGNPIYGDRLYGAPQTDERTKLHCKKIEFIHPSTKRKITLIAPCPADINKIIEKNIVI